MQMCLDNAKNQGKKSPFTQDIFGFLLNKSPPWHIEISASDSWELNNGHFGGEIRATHRELHIDLTPKDFSRLVSLTLAKEQILVRELDLQTRKQIALNVLREFNDADLLSFLAELIPSRPSDRV